VFRGRPARHRPNQRHRRGTQIERKVVHVAGDVGLSRCRHELILSATRADSSCETSMADYSEEFAGSSSCPLMNLNPLSGRCRRRIP